MSADSSSSGVVVITGGHRGIGGALAGELRLRGVGEVVAASRESGLDLLSRRSIASFAERVAPRGVSLLVNNAGAMFAERQLTDDGFERTLAVNCLGPLLLTERLAPARVLNIVTLPLGTVDLTDLHGARRYRTFSAYLAAKLAFMHVARAWAARGLNVQSLMPGMVRTPMLKAPALGGGLMAWVVPLLGPFAARPEAIGTIVADLIASKPESDTLWSRARLVPWSKKLRDAQRNAEVYEALRSQSAL